MADRDVFTMAQQMSEAVSAAPLWSAIAAWLTAVTAIAAASFAFMQVRHARRIRQEQAQPYVAVFLESSIVSPHFVELVIKNYGTTAARNVRIDVSPAPRRSGQGGEPPEPVEFPATLPTLVPTQEWRTLWDFSPERKEQDLEQQHKALVTCDGVLGAGRLSFEYDLNWDLFIGRRWVQTYGIHDAAKALREMERQMRGWREGPNRGLKVYVRSGEKRDEQLRQELKDAKENHERLMRDLTRGDRSEEGE